MNYLRLLALAALAAACGAPAWAEESNFWPFRVAQTDASGDTVSWTAAGPLLFEQPAGDGATLSGFRPVFATWTGPGGRTFETDVLYPLFVHRTTGDTYRWSVFELINKTGRRDPHEPTGAARQVPETFDVWPFWFSRETGEPATSYHALFPLHGTIKDRFGYDRLDFTLFPLYGRAEKSGAVTTATPWPFVKTYTGTDHGFALWPLYGTREKPGAYHRQFFLWPLGWDNTIEPGSDAPVGTPPRREVGFLPFFTRETDAGFVNASYLWPFFGYTDRTAPKRYHETRYLWPFLVQGRGDDKFVDRWGPFYTHSINHGIDKQWILWPLYRQKELTDRGLDQTQRQLFYFVYWSLEQRSATNPNAAPAEVTHLWPLFSAWDNGAGRRQFQFPSPLEVFFPANKHVHASWSPLFSLYRYDQRAPGDERYEFLWGLLTWHRSPDSREFHLGPLLSVKDRPEGDRIALGHGLVGLRRASDRDHWRLFWFDFGSKANKLSGSSR
ncbi:MAG TPA: hypothetical protein VHE13_07680 [Opitutus sp.]|nr:hypothetical protein [Opitutus sp.]